MQILKQAARVGACVGLTLNVAWAADISNADTPSYKDSGDYWVVTIGALGGATPLFPGSKTETGTVFPIFDIHRSGTFEWFGVPTDSASITLYQTGNFRFGAAGDYITNRDSSDTSDLKGLKNIDYTVELGAFAEYYPLPFLRTRAELLQGVSGAEGFEARLKADFIYRPDAQWVFTAGPRLDFVNTQYASTFFSVHSNEVGPSGLSAYHAAGGLNSAGADVTARYYVSDNFSLRAFADWERLVGDAADSPIVRLRGSTDQFQFGIGGAVRFTYPR
jgi:outer membrane protein